MRNWSCLAFGSQKLWAASKATSRAGQLACRGIDDEKIPALGGSSLEKTMKDRENPIPQPTAERARHNCATSTSLSERTDVSFATMSAVIRGADTIDAGFYVLTAALVKIPEAKELYEQLCKIRADIDGIREKLNPAVFF